MVDGQYQLPRLVTELYKKHAVSSGSILDVGCGTGLLATTLQGDFSYTGVDISSNMLAIAKSRGYQTIEGDIATIAPTLDDCSYDHVVVMSCIYFIPNFATLLVDLHRIARKTVLVSFDNFSEAIIKKVKDESGEELLNYSSSLMPEFTDKLTREYLWRSPINPNVLIFGDVVFCIKHSF
jgi:ubiquinone/menaquinone biosynthesis C-methylase UbiE